MPQQTLHPAFIIKRWQLTLIILFAILVPFSIVVWLTSTTKSKPEPKLDAEYSFEVLEWSAGPGTPPSLKPGIRVRNPSKDDWNNVSFSLNNQFFYYHPRTVISGESVALPLAQFVTKGGNVAFHPASQKVVLITIFAQIPSGARGVFEEKVDPKKSTPAP